ncbi:Protein of unknown function [Propionibacterium freudenreichii]|nr:Protein of unknown function [Propionibacterium freudenreichii]
MTMVPYDF